MVIGGPPVYGAEHVCHCFTYIYQGLQCSADATLEEQPLLTRSKAHVCNDFYGLREWLYNEERNSGLQYNGTHYIDVPSEELRRAAWY